MRAEARARAGSVLKTPTITLSSRSRSTLSPEN
jgi:hypothetical protein